MDIRETMERSQEAIAGQAGGQGRQAPGQDRTGLPAGRQAAKKTELEPCKYCGGEAVIFVTDGRNFEGAPGFVATSKCRRCLMSTTAFSSDRKYAIRIVTDRWNRR